MEESSIVYTLFLIFCGAALLATLAMTVRQSLIIAYIGLGLLIGPWGINLISDIGLIQNIANVGIVFLLFLLGLNLHPQELIRLAGEATIVTGASSLALLGLGFGYSLMFGYSTTEALIVGAALMFSSTIIGLKLIPTTVLHHQRTGEIIISVLLLQDIIAIFLLLLIEGSADVDAGWTAMLQPVLAFPLLVGAAYVLEKNLLSRLIARFDRIRNTFSCSRSVGAWEWRKRQKRSGCPMRSGHLSPVYRSLAARSRCLSLKTSSRCVIFSWSSSLLPWGRASTWACCQISGSPRLGSA